METENDINERSNVDRHENNFEGKDGTEIQRSVSTKKQYRLILQSNEKTHLLSSSSNRDKLETQRKRISEFLLNTDNFSLNLLIERSYRLRFYFALILVSFAIISIGILIAILSFYFLFNPRLLEYKCQNHSPINSTTQLLNSTKQLDNKNTELDLECNKFKQLNTDLYNRCKECLENNSRQENEVETLRKRKNEALKSVRELKVLLYFEAKSSGAKINITGSVTGSTFNFGEISGKVQNIIEQLQQSDIPKEPPSRKRSK